METFFINFMRILAAIMGAMMSLGYFSQAYKIYKNKSSKNVSKMAYLIFSLGTLTWLIYGISIKDLSIILGFAIGVVGSWLTLILSIIYKRK